MVRETGLEESRWKDQKAVRREAVISLELPWALKLNWQVTSVATSTD